MRRTMMRRGSTLVSLLAVAFVVVVVASATWHLLLRPTPERTVRAMIAAAGRGDQEAVAALITERSKDYAASWARLIGRLASGDDSGKPSYSLGEARIEGRAATVPVTFAVGSSALTLVGIESVTIDHALVSGAGHWKVDLQETMRNVGSSALGGTLFRAPGSPREP